MFTNFFNFILQITWVSCLTRQGFFRNIRYAREAGIKKEEFT